MAGGNGLIDAPAHPSIKLKGERLFWYLAGYRPVNAVFCRADIDGGTLKHEQSD